MTITITTNGHARELIAYAELTDKERSEFDYIADEESWDYRFARYRGNVIDVSDMRAIMVSPAFQSFGVNVAPESPLAAWHGVASDSYWSGIVVRYCDDNEHVVIGRYFDGGED